MKIRMFLLGQKCRCPGIVRHSLQLFSRNNPTAASQNLLESNPPPEEDLKTESCGMNIHVTRETNLSNLKLEKENAIIFPPSRDPKWKEVNSELEIALPKVFTKAKMNRMSISKLSKSFLKWIHAFFAEKFGLKDNTPYSERVRREPRVHEGLARLRKQKRDLTKAKKALLKAGHTSNSRAMIILSQTWRKVTKKHNRMRIAAKKWLEKRACRAAENNFKKDQTKFAKELFHGTGQSAAPTFSKEECQEYFGKTYRDENR